MTKTNETKATKATTYKPGTRPARFETRVERDRRLGITKPSNKGMDYFTSLGLHHIG